MYGIVAAGRQASLGFDWLRWLDGLVERLRPSLIIYDAFSAIVAAAHPCCPK
jgi:hypothetical protein